MIALWWMAFAVAAEGPWLGLPAERAAELGLGAPTISEEIPGLQRYPLGTGGLVSITVRPTVAEAEAVFDQTARTGATSWPPAPGTLPGERALGDGVGILLVRDANVVILVRDPGGAAADVARRVIDALSPR